MLIEPTFCSGHWASGDHTSAMASEISQNYEQIPPGCRLAIHLIEPLAAPAPIMWGILKDQLFGLAGFDLVLCNVRDVYLVPF